MLFCLYTAKYEYDEHIIWKFFDLQKVIVMKLIYFIDVQVRIYFRYEKRCEHLCGNCQTYGNTAALLVD